MDFLQEASDGVSCFLFCYEVNNGELDVSIRHGQAERRVRPSTRRYSSETKPEPDLDNANVGIPETRVL